MFRSFALAAALAAAVLSGHAHADVVRTGADLLMSCGKNAPYSERAPCIYWLDSALDTLDWPAHAFGASGAIECPKTESDQDFATWVPRMIGAFNTYWADPAAARRLATLSRQDAAIEALAKAYPECSKVISS